MSAAPRVDTAPGRLRLRRVAFARLARQAEALGTSAVNEAALEPAERDALRIEADAEKSVQVAQGAGAKGNPGYLLAVLVERLLRLGDDEPEPAERELLATLVRVLEQQTRSAAKAGPCVARLLDELHEAKRERRLAGKSLGGRKYERLRRKLRRARAALARIVYVHDPEKKPLLIDALNEGSWAGFRVGPNVVQLPWNSAADDARFEVVRRFLADFETARRALGQEKVSPENDSTKTGHLR